MDFDAGSCIGEARHSTIGLTLRFLRPLLPSRKYTKFELEFLISSKKINVVDLMGKSKYVFLFYRDLRLRNQQQINDVLHISFKNGSAKR